MKDLAPEAETDPPLFMWAGGKGRMIKYYSRILPDNLHERHYVEPFAGGAALFSHLTSRSAIESTLCDINTDLIDLYRLVRDDPETLIEFNRDLEKDWMKRGGAERKALYYQARRDYWEMPDGPRATARLLFLMKTGFNGIWQTCKASNGRFGTPVGLANQKTRVIVPEIVRRWSEKLRDTTLRSGSYETNPIPPDAFVFCDPPYRNSFMDYGNGFDDNDQIALIDWCRHIHERHGATVWLSNRDAGDRFFERHATDAQKHSFPITYTAGRRRKTSSGYQAKQATELLMIWN